MNCLLRIRQMYATLAHNERKLADFLLAQPDRARHLSSPKLALAAGVSQSAVVKFAQKLGYAGFPALKLSLNGVQHAPAAEPAIALHNHILSDDPLRIVGEKLLHEKQAALRATLDINSEDRLLQGLALLRQARRVVLIGMGTSGLAARDFAWKLMKIGLLTVAEADMHASLSLMQALTPDDLLIALSYSGERPEILLAAQEAQRAGAKVLALTSFSPNRLQQQADLALYTMAEERATRSAAIASTTAQLAITDLLFMALIQRDVQHAPERIRHSEALIKKLI